MFFLFNLFAIVIGLCLGSFLHCLAWRLYHNEPLRGRSRCPRCQAKIVWYDNIPVLSFLLLNGRCRHCQEAIASRYFLTEVITGALFWLAFSFNVQPTTLLPLLAGQGDGRWLLAVARDWVFIAALVVVFLMDALWLVVADKFVLGAAAIVLILNLLLGISWQNLAVAAVAVVLFFGAQLALSHGAWIGDGDLYIGALVGLALGWPNILVALMLAYCSGAVWGLWQVATGRKKFQWRNLTKPDQAEIAQAALPLGVFLALGSWVALYWGGDLISWYLSLLR